MLENGSHSDAVIMDSGERPKYLLEFLYLGAKHPLKNKIIELHFLADLTILVRYLRKNKMERETLRN